MTAGANYKQVYEQSRFFMKKYLLMKNIKEVAPFPPQALFIKNVNISCLYEKTTMFKKRAKKGNTLSAASAFHENCMNKHLFHVNASIVIKPPLAIVGKNRSCRND